MVFKKFILENLPLSDSYRTVNLQLRFSFPLIIHFVGLSLLPSPFRGDLALEDYFEQAILSLLQSDYFIKFALVTQYLHSLRYDPQKVVFSQQGLVVRDLSDYAEEFWEKTCPNQVVGTTSFLNRSPTPQKR